MDQKTEFAINYNLTPMEAEQVIRGVAKLSIEEGGALFQKLQMQFRTQVMAQQTAAAEGHTGKTAKK